MDVNQFILDFILLFVFTWAFIKFVVKPLMQWKYDRELGDAKQILEELENETLIPLQVESHGDEYLCYNSITNDFVCQGRDIAEIMKKFHDRYPDKNAALHRGDEAALKTLKQQLQEYRENSNSVGSTS